VTTRGRSRALPADPRARILRSALEVFSELDPNALAALILGAVEGAENQWLIDPERVDPVTVIRQLRWLFRASVPAPARVVE
jgi:hypothetical protein